MCHHNSTLRCQWFGSNHHKEVYVVIATTKLNVGHGLYIMTTWCCGDRLRRKHTFCSRRRPIGELVNAIIPRATKSDPTTEGVTTRKLGVCVGRCRDEDFISLGVAVYAGLALDPCHLTASVHDKELDFRQCTKSNFHQVYKFIISNCWGYAIRMNQLVRRLSDHRS